MLIEFKIQLDGSGGATVVPSTANAVNPSLPRETVLGSSFGAAGATAASPVASKGGDAPIGGPGTGPPTGSVSSSGSGTVFVIGPIVICGSGPGHTGPGGDAPIGGPGTGQPKASS
jgi:hypothetical protein